MSFVIKKRRKNEKDTFFNDPVSNGRKLCISENSPVVSCTFTFTNIGDAPLVIHQAVASCGCTVPEYTKEPIMPGKKGTIKVTYNGTGKYPGHFKKSITLRTNAKTEMVRLYIEGDMTAKDAK